MPFDFLHFRRPALCRSRFVASVWAAFACLLLSGTSVAAPGQLDPTFGNGGIARSSIANSEDVANAIVQQPDGDWIVAGSCYFSNPIRSYRPCLRRYSSSGVQDTSFGASGVVVLEVTGLGHAFAAGVRPDGKIVVAGVCGSDNLAINTDACVVQYLPSGAVDSNFGINGQLKVGNGWAYALALQDDGKVVAAGSCGGTRVIGQLLTPFDFCVWRVTLTGTMDAAFGSSGVVRVDFDGKDDVASGLAITTSGHIVVGGGCADPVQTPTHSVFCALRLNPDGQLDTSFASSGKFALSLVGGVESVSAIRIQTDSKVLIAGACNGNQWCVVRLTAGGLLDSTFAQGGVFRHPSFTGAAADLSIQLDGRILVVGACSSTEPTCQIRLNENGTPDGNYGLGGVTSLAIGVPAQNGFGAPSLALQMDGKALVAATCTVGVAQYEFCVARLDGEPFGVATCTLNADANQVVESGTDAVLVVRYLLGFRGEALSRGALGAYPSRNRQALENYLASLNLDADGDGQSLAMTDGLVILRAMLGLTGDALTAGAVNTAHPNARNAQQILTWIESTHGVACLP